MKINNTNSNFEILLNYTIPILTLFLISLPALIGTYVHHNDTTVFHEDSHLYAIGRPLGGFLINIQFYFFESLHGLQSHRIISFLFLILFFIILRYLLAVRFKLNYLFATATAFLIVILPTAQISIFWISQIIPNWIALFFTVGSFWLIDSMIMATDKSPSKTEKSTQTVLIKAFAGAVCLIIAILIYPPTSMFYLMLVICCILFPMIPSNRDEWMFILKHLIFFGVVAFFSLIFIKFIYPSILHELSPRIYKHLVTLNTSDISINLGQYSTEFPSDPFKKIAVLNNLIKLAIAGVLGPFAKYSDILKFILLIELALFSLIIFRIVSSFQNSRENRKTNSIIRKIGLPVTAISIIILISFSPNLIAQGHVIAFRTIYAATAIFILIGIKLIIVARECSDENDFFEKLIMRTSTFIMISFSIIAAITTSRAVANDTVEYTAIVQGLRKALNSNIKEIAIRPRPRGCMLVKGKLQYEYSLNLSESHFFLSIAIPILTQQFKVKNLPNIVVCANCDPRFQEKHSNLIDLNGAALQRYSCEQGRETELAL